MRAGHFLPGLCHQELPLLLYVDQLPQGQGQSDAVRCASEGDFRCGGLQLECSLSCFLDAAFKIADHWLASE